MSEADFIAFPPSEAGSSTLKKPSRPLKERINTTLFVSSLPYTATSTDLVTHFSYLGPVRHGFVATDRASGKSKGVGYVTYALKEDAEQAVAELDNKDFGGDGRKIRVAWANTRPGTLERIKKSEIPRAPELKIQPGIKEEAEGSRDPNAIRTVILTGVPDVTKAVLWKKVRKVHEGIDLQFPVDGKEGTAYLVFPGHGDAVKGLGKLNGHTYKDNILSAVLKKRMEKAGPAGKGVSHAGRLIIRNLAWNTTEQDLRATFLPYGPVHSIDLPKAPSKFAERNGKEAAPRARGFAFVWFISKADAEKAIDGVNGKPIKYASDAAKPKPKVKAGEKEVERVVAVDWALSKDKWNEAKGSEEGVKQEPAGSDGEEEASEDEEGSSGQDKDVKMDAGEEEKDVKPVKPQLPSVDVGSTLFIRNLPFEVTEQELNTLFRSFGPLRYARITVDKSTGRSRGSGFVCFWNVEHADAAMEEADRVNQETGTNSIPLGGGNNPFALPSVLTVDPSSSLASKLVINGRTLDVSRAVTREQAGLMKEDGERARQSGDKRNTYLMREGVIFPNSPAAASLPPAELERRQEAFNARRTLLRSNPSLYISKTRLSIRQLPLFVTDRTLKRLAIHATRTFDQEVSSEAREGLTRVEELDDTLSPALAAKAEKAERFKAKGKGKGKVERETPVIQSKVVRQSEKVDPLTNAGRSKGYGFLEMRSHKEALKVLRWANNNADVGELVWGWWKVELQEMLERAKKDLEGRRAGAAAKAATAGGSDEDGEEAGPAVDQGKGKEKESTEELEARVRKLEERCREGDERSGGGMRGGKTLMIEFSIENVQVVKRRVEKITTARQESSAGGGGYKRKAAEESEDENGAATQPPAERKRSRDDRRGDKRDRPDRSDRSDRSSKKPRTDSDSKTRGPPVQPSEPGTGKGKKERARERTAKRDQQRKDRAGPADTAVAAPTAAATEKRGIEKLGANMGSMIGRKRRQKKGGK